MIKMLILAFILLLMITFLLAVAVLVLVQNNIKLRKERGNLWAYINGVGIMEGDNV